MEQEKIDPAQLVPMDIFEGAAPVRVRLAYAGADSFCGAVYRPDARLWLHEDLAAIVVLAARLAGAQTGGRMVVYDGLRTTDAQELMRQSPAVRAHPQWLAGETRVLSPPGLGGHPRAMAVDVALEDAHGTLLDMGTAFDELPDGGNGPATNRAHRLYADLSAAVKANRQILEQAMVEAARRLSLPLLPLPVEWWDFRFPADMVNRYAPLSDADLPPQMRMTDFRAPGLKDFDESHFQDKKSFIINRINDI